MGQREEFSQGPPGLEHATFFSSREAPPTADEAAPRSSARPVRATLAARRAAPRQGLWEICFRGQKVFAARRRRVKLKDRTSVLPVRSFG